MDLLVVEDDPVLGKALQKGLDEAGHQCTLARSGKRGLESALEQQFDAVVLDLMLPDLPGLDVLRDLRQRGIHTPVLVLTALGSVEERVAGLTSGADDYLVKPFAFAELMARLEAVCRRSAVRPSTVLKVGPLQLDLTTRRVMREDVEVDLTPTEFSLLEFLMRYSGQVVTRKMLCEHLWESDWEGVTNVIEVHVTRLRGKIDREFGDPLIHTVREAAAMFFGRAESVRWSLRFQLMIWNAGAVLITALAILLGVREGIRYTLVHELDLTLLDELREIGLAVDELQSLHPEELRQALDRKARAHTMHHWFVRMLDHEGNEVWASESVPAEPLALPRGADSQPVSVGEFRVVEHRHPIKGATPITIRVGTSLDFVDRDVARIDRLVAIAVAVVLVVAPLGGYWLAGRATRPLASIIRTTARLRPRQLDERLPVSRAGDEIDQLSRTVNGLLDRIATYLEEKRDFLANAAHELRTPLAAIHSSIEVALNSDRTRDEYKDLLAVLIQECAGLELLVNQLLLLAETDSDRLKFHSDEVPLHDVVEKALEMFSGAAEFSDINLCSTALYPSTVPGNRHHLRQVINNLLDNALKHTPAGGAVSVRLHHDSENNMAVLSVQDTGEGIAPEDLPHVFERFYRGDKARTRQGTGLGLSICQAIVVAHGGRISMHSKPGQGTTATVTLPLTRQGETPPLHVAAPLSATASGPGP